jgi:hypothetical protein
MMRIDRTSTDDSRPFENLLPLVSLLVESGNRAIDGGFLLDPDGWRCRLADPIGFEVVRANVELPANIQISEEHDSILDRLSWCVIEGPGAHP